MSDFLKILDGQEIDGQQRLQLMDAFVDLQEASLGQPPDYVRPAIVKSSGDVPVTISTLEFGTELTERLVIECRRNGISVHGALCAAAVWATQSERQAPLRLSSPVDVRRTVGADAKALGIFMALALNSLEPEPGETFWELARRAMVSIAAAQEKKAVDSLFTVLDSIVPIHGDAQAAQAVLAPFTLDLMISNLGKVAAPRTSSRLHVEALWGPALNTQIEANDVIGVTTYGGNLRMLHTGSRLGDDMLRAIQQVVAEQMLMRPGS